MANAFQFELVSPERLLLSAEVESVLVPGSEGDFQVFADHAPVMTTLRPGLIVVGSTEEGAPREVFVRGGFAEVGPDGLTILAEQAIFIADLDKAEVEQRLQNAREDVEDAKDDEGRRSAEEAVRQLTELLSAVGG